MSNEDYNKWGVVSSGDDDPVFRDVVARLSPAELDSRAFMLVTFVDGRPALHIQGPPQPLAAVMTDIMQSMFHVECEYHILRSISPDCPVPPVQ